MIITFANGETRYCTLCTTNQIEQTAFIAIDKTTFADAATIFSNPAYTRRMQYGNYVLMGYTELMYIMQEPYGVKACLRGGHDEIIHENQGE